MGKAADLVLLLAVAGLVIGGAVWLARRRPAAVAAAGSSPAPIGAAEVNARAAMLARTGSPDYTMTVPQFPSGSIDDWIHYATPGASGWRVPIAYPGTLD